MSWVFFSKCNAHTIKIKIHFMISALFLFFLSKSPNHKILFEIFFVVEKCLMGYNGKTCLCVCVYVCENQTNELQTITLAFVLFCLLFNKLFLFLGFSFIVFDFLSKICKFLLAMIQKKNNKKTQIVKQKFVILFRERRNYTTN